VHRDAGGDFHRQPGGVIGEFLREAIQVEATHAQRIFAQVLAAGAAGLAGPADQRRIRHDAVAGEQACDAIADGDDFARGLGAHHQRILAAGEGHAAKAPDVDVVQPDRIDAKLHLAGRGGRGRVALGQCNLAVGEKPQRTHRWHRGWRPSGQGGGRRVS